MSWHIHLFVVDVAAPSRELGGVTAPSCEVRGEFTAYKGRGVGVETKRDVLEQKRGANRCYSTRYVVLYFFAISSQYLDCSV